MMVCFGQNSRLGLKQIRKFSNLSCGLSGRFDGGSMDGLP
jgi:hypothetical protein